MNKELIEAINLLEKENNISKDVLLEAIENSLLTAYKNNYGRADNVKVNIYLCHRLMFTLTLSARP